MTCSKSVKNKKKRERRYVIVNVAYLKNTSSSVKVVSFINTRLLCSAKNFLQHFVLSNHGVKLIVKIFWKREILKKRHYNILNILFDRRKITLHEICHKHVKKFKMQEIQNRFRIFIYLFVLFIFFLIFV